MNIHMLMTQIEQPEVQRALLAGYQGPFSIGIGTDSPADPDPVVIVRVGDATHVHAPEHIDVAGESVRVVVQGNYVSPQKLPQRLS